MNLRQALSTSARVLFASALVLFADALVHARAPVPRTVHVFNAEELYTAVNEAGNAGARIVLAAGYYALSPMAAGSKVRLNGGRLELQLDMTLSGQPGDPEAVVIDAAGLPAASYLTPQGDRSGPLRAGRGSNTIEWLTVLNGAAGAAGIDTGLVAGPMAHVRLAHLVMKDHQRGFDIRNNANAAGRILEVDLEDNDLSLNSGMFGFGMRFINQGASGAVIRARLRGNLLHDNNVGLLAANLNSSGASIAIASHADHFDRNLVGVILFAGNANIPNAQANDNMLSFDAHGSTIRDNTGVFGELSLSGGLVAIGGVTSQADRASNNTLRAGLWGTKFSGNQDFDINAWGARTVAAAPAGTNNHVEIALQGVSRQATDAQVPSEPEDPGGTNTVTINR